MVKYYAILKAVNDKLTANFPTIPVVSESDVEEKIIRPSFMTTLDNIEPKDFMNYSVDKNLKVRIFYFACTRDKNKLENLKMLDSLDAVFLEDNNLNVDNFNISIGRINVDINESKVLEYNFELAFSENYERDDSDTENMEDMHLTIKEEWENGWHRNAQIEYHI